MTGSAVKRLGALHDGQRRRFDIAFSLITRPEILLLDEPTKDLGPAARGEFHEVIRYLAIGEGMTIILTTRDLAEAQRIGDRVAVLMQGRLVTQCAPAEAWMRYPGTPCDFQDLRGHNWCPASSIWQGFFGFECWGVRGGQSQMHLFGPVP